MSVVLATFDGAATVERAIRSVLGQTHSDLELIVVDDASRDDTVAIVSAVSAGDARVAIERLGENSGAPARPRNVGLARASGDVVGFLDQDDEWLPNALESIADRFLAHPDAAVVYGDVLTVVEGQPAGTFFERWPGQLAGAGPQLLAGLLRRNFIPNLGAWSRTDVVRRLGGVAEDLPGVDDYDLWLRIAADGLQFAINPDVVGRHHMSTSTFSRDSLRQTEAMCRCLDRLVAPHDPLSADAHAAAITTARRRRAVVLGAAAFGRGRPTSGRIEAARALASEGLLGELARSASRSNVWQWGRPAP